MMFSNSSSDEYSLSNHLHGNSSSNEDSSDSDMSPQKSKRSCSLRLSDLDIEDTEDEELIPQLARASVSKRYLNMVKKYKSIIQFFRLFIDCV